VVPYGDLQQSRLHTTRSDSSVSMPGSRLQRIMEGLRVSNHRQRSSKRKPSKLLVPSKESNKKYGKRCWPTLPATTRGTRFVQATAKEAGTTEPEPPLHCRQCAPTPPQPRRRTCFTSGTSPSSFATTCSFAGPSTWT
jgi:hypothetical protein